MIGIDMKLEGIEEAKKLVSKDLFKKILGEAVFNTAYDAKKNLTEEMKIIFDRPTPYVLRGIRIQVNKLDMSVAISPEDFPVGHSPADVLLPHIEGGGRPMKRSENHLGNYWTPGAGARLNQYGNISGGQITQLLSVLRRLPESGYAANITPRSKKRNIKPRDYFMTSRTNRGLRAGVWERYGGGRVRPILIFGRPPTYYKRFKYFEILEKSILKNIQRRFNDAFDNAFIAK